MNTVNDTYAEHMQTNPTLKERFSLFGIVWSLLVIVTGVAVWLDLHTYMDVYEKAILIGAVPGLIALGAFWPSIRLYLLGVAALTLLGVWQYSSHGNDVKVQEQLFLLKYLLSSQSAFMWMSALYVLATAGYFFALFIRSEFAGKVATGLTWAGATFGLTGMMMRWYESYLINPDYGHIPISSLYEVFILFSVITALVYLYFEQKYRTRALGGFVMLVVSAAVAFLLWYTFDREAYHIQPLVPALKSYWMKLHVPANFLGYGAFALAAMVGAAYLITDTLARKKPDSTFVKAMPSLEMMDELMYKSIAFGFAFFTIATILGAVWAAEAWGGYWSWDPKETWALIVWLNYAAWLHLRMTKGWRGRPMAWWALVGLLVTTFAFLGVNMFLSGLHSYGKL
ncbi:cytochrome c-type biogenesis protein CcsB [Sulfurivirga caldicuralii]|uniref:Cytochrome c-type biogenesis protein CcsB n=2 Tax=Sulfurivirga caldicuralii TaxID=364032 RepID=A0A1N6HB86_9GAMM|nr:c-type cytochrome biogenesis protein CcsB [Sulfurivirga caldicuralii]SIO16915.1 cytochrome c-type biogenesis protein CcsB [Sulfurivirga caldicuralii]